jgi:hypothetical protein
MKKIPLFWVFVALSLAFPLKMLAGGPSWLDALNPFRGTPVDVHHPDACENCGHEGSVERAKIEECVVGEKKVYTTSIHKEYVSIPEVRYRYVMKCIVQEVPADYCKTVPKIENVDHQFQAEQWCKDVAPCGDELLTKRCVTQTEKLPVATGCDTKPGKTTVKVHVWTCVKEAYTVYRQVEKEVAVKQPHYEKCEVKITRHECTHCGGLGCEFCKPQQPACELK